MGFVTAAKMLFRECALMGLASSIMQHSCVALIQGEGAWPWEAGCLGQVC